MQMTIQQFQKLYQKGDFADSCREVQITAGWWDWFCPDRQLSKRLKLMYDRIISKISNDRLLNEFQCNFSNHCPISSPLYDNITFRYLGLVDDPSLDPSFDLSIRSFGKGEPLEYIIYFDVNSCDYSIEFKTSDEVVEFINNWFEEREKFVEKSKQDKAALDELISRSKALLDELNDLIED